MNRTTILLGSLIVVAAGCASIPEAIQAPAPPTVKTKFDPNFMTVDIALTVDLGGRRVQYNGGSGALQNDINNLIVGIFDNGSVTSALASLGYLYTGAVGAASPTAAALSAVNAPYIPAATHGISEKLGTAGTGAASSGETITTDKSNLRRYLVRDFGTATGFQSASTTVSFTNIPTDDGTSGTHEYIIFAAAYDAGTNNLGYTEASLAASKTQGSSNTTAAALTLNLKQGVFTSNLSETPVLTPYVPSATFRIGL